MKALIVDDEEHVRNCIELLADWDVCGVHQVFEAGTFTQAVACIEANQPQLVITDIRMPQHDGLELMAWIHEKYPQTVMIVISAYNDFDYAIQSMRYGVLDYLLKPIQPDQLNKLLEKAGTILLKKRKELADSQFQLNVSERIMMALFIEGDAPLPNHSRLQQLFHAPLGFLVMDTLCVCRKSAVPVETKEVLSYLSEQFQQRSADWVLQGVNHPDLLYALLTGDSNAQKNHTQQVTEALETRFGIQMHHILRCNGVWQSETLPQIAKEITTAICGRSIFNCYGGTMLHSPANLSSFFEVVQKGDIVQASSQVENWVDHLRQVRHLTREDFGNWWNVLCSECGKFLALHPGTGEHPAFLQNQCFLPVLDTHLHFSPERLIDYLSAQIRVLAANYELPPVENIDLAKRVENLIRLHYAEQLSLSSIADRFFRSPSHIARIFKEQYQISVVNYITQVRIEHAKVLLKTSDYRISKVAHMVGYNDEKYFCRVFKKHAGLSPADFKKI